jgi:diguanylate cyclase (GGDEF)-like protein
MRTRALAEANAKLEVANHKLEALTEEDTLTTCFNRRGFNRKFEDAWQRAIRERTSLALLMLDIDHFKQINDRHGHPVGDQALMALAQVLTQRVRRGVDTVARYGGEEFMILFTGLSGPTVAAILERVRNNVATHRFPQVGQVTVSIGYCRAGDGLIPTQLIEKADRALYFAKENGRNQVWNYADLIDSGQIEKAPESGSIELF